MSATMPAEYVEAFFRYLAEGTPDDPQGRSDGRGAHRRTANIGAVGNRPRQRRAVTMRQIRLWRKAPVARNGQG